MAPLVVDILTLLIAVAGFLGAIAALRQGNRQQLLEIGNLYMERYWRIDDDLLHFAKGSPEHRQARHRYLRLCEDEYEAARAGLLHMKQWGLWHEWLANPAQRERLRQDIEVCASSEQGFVFLRSCLATEVSHNWKACPARTITF